MKKIVLLSLIALAILASCQREAGTWLTLTNPLDQERTDATILITAEELKQWAEVPDGKLPLLLEKSGVAIPCQADDFDGDGKWDELFVVLDMAALEEKNVHLVFRDPADYPTFKNRTNVRLGKNEKGYPELTLADRLDGVSYHNHSLTGKAYQMEGPAWENDFVGFRNYLDQRNGMDVFGKISREMVLDSVGIAGRGSYHEPDDWGMDILKVGTSLGAGSIGYYLNDSIYRIGDNGKGTYELIVDGNLRSILSFQNKAWQMDDALLDVSHIIEIQAGTHFYEAAVSYSGSDLEIDLVTGIVNIKSDQLFVEKVNEDYTALYTHDKQSEDTTIMGMGLLIPNRVLIEYGESKKSGEGITETYFARMKTGQDEVTKFRFYSVWEKEDEKWIDPDQFLSLMREDAERFSNPLTVELKSN